MFAKLALAVVASAFMLPAAMAADCALTVEANDAMQFNTKEITVDKACEKYTLTLKHVGKLPVTAMGHNWVLTKKADMQSAATDGMAAGAGNEYIKPDDARVIAHTGLIGGGQESAVTFDVSKLAAGEEYAFFCSFPGHWAIMKGSLKLSS